MDAEDISQRAAADEANGSVDVDANTNAYARTNPLHRIPHYDPHSLPVAVELRSNMSGVIEQSDLDAPGAENLVVAERRSDQKANWAMNPSQQSTPMYVS